MSEDYNSVERRATTIAAVEEIGYQLNKQTLRLIFDPGSSKALISYKCYLRSHV